jgi:uncharacterized repeat protein (TIGR01451 family)
MPDRKMFSSLARPILFSVLLFSIIIPAVSFAQPDTVPPTSPANVIATAVPHSKVVLSWKPAADNIGVAGYNVLRRPAAGGNLAKLNTALIKGLSYEDKNVASGKNYEYVVRAVDAAGNTSPDSTPASAPSIIIKESTVISHMGKTVKTAVPGDSIEYVIDYTNVGYGYATGVSIQHSVPKGTTYLASSAKAKKGPKVSLLYLDRKTNKWVDKYDAVENVSKVKFVINENVPAMAKGPNGTVSLKVVVGE